MTSVSSAPTPPESDASAEHVVEGVGVAPGIAIGPAFRYVPDAPHVDESSIDASDVDDEMQLFEAALDRAERDLERIASIADEKLGDESLGIFEAQQMMLRDDELLRPVRRRITERRENAGHAVRAVMREHRQRLEASDNEYLRERASDLVDVQDRILRALRRGKFAASIEPGSIIVAESISASEVMHFSRDGILGCATDRGGATSHVSIIARALEIPALVGAGAATDAVSDGDTIILDGLRGRLIVNPSAETLDAYRVKQERYDRLVQEQNRLAGLPSETTDGTRVTLRANVEFGQELGLLDRYGAEGIGLLRTELLFLMENGASLSEEEQVEAYRKAADASAPHDATVRLLDLGGDKIMPLAHREHNPFLGWRGIRVLLDRPELLRPQLRALLRANADGALRMLLPMVTQTSEIQRIREALQTEADRLADAGVPHDADLPLGVMVEVPAVALQADRFAEEADFFSIGTNDLTQYVLAVDRGNDLVADRFDALHPAVLSLVRQTVDAARRAEIPVSVCGEIASDIQATPILLGLGLTRFSASPTYLPAIKRIVRVTDVDAARALANEALNAPDAETVRALSREWIDARIDRDLSYEE